MKSTHIILYQPALHHSGCTQLIWSDSDEQLNSSCHGLQTIALQKLQEAAVFSITQLAASLDNLLEQCGTTYMALCLSQELLSDNTASHNSFLDSSNINSLFLPVVNQAMGVIWLQLHSMALLMTLPCNCFWTSMHLLAASTLLTCGNPLHGFQLVEMKYRKHDTMLRNLYLMDKQAVLCAPQAKGHSGATQPSF